MTAGARALGMSQPALTAAMKELERELGTTLFVRTSQGVTLTRTGETLLVHARGIVRAEDEVRSVIDDLEHEPRGRFVLGCHESLGAYFLPGILPRFFSEQPAIEVALWNSNSKNMLEAVVERRIDVGTVVNPSPRPDCVIVLMFTDPVGLIASASLHESLAGDPLALLDRVPLVYVPVLSQVQWILARLPSARLDGSTAPRRHLTCSSMEFVNGRVIDGAGVGILPRRVAAHRLPAGTLVDLAPEAPAFDDTIALVRRVDLRETRAARLLHDALKVHGRARDRGARDTPAPVLKPAAARRQKTPSITPTVDRRSRRPGRRGSRTPS
ncbi:MAG: LysR family transcriptional regulator [Deltaproteobacteria bacterium]